MSLISLNDKKIFLAGHKGMVGSEILKQLKLLNIEPLVEEKKALNLLNQEAVEVWFQKNKPEVVIVAAAKVGGIFANDTYPAEFLIENLKIQNNVIESSFKYNVKKTRKRRCV